MGYLNNWEGPGYWDDNRREEAHAQYVEESAREIASKFEEYVATFMKYPIHAKAFAMCLATAYQDSGIAPVCMDIEEIDVDCFMYVNRVPTKDNDWDIKRDMKNMDIHFGDGSDY